VCVLVGAQSTCFLQELSYVWVEVLGVVVLSVFRMHDEDSDHLCPELVAAVVPLEDRADELEEHLVLV